MIDGHCHIIPGVDDGAKTVEDSRQMLTRARELGISKIICTSHTKDKFAPPKIQQEKLKEILPIADAMGIELVWGTEVHWSKFSEISDDEAKQCTFGNSNLFLLEFSWNHITDMWQNVIYRAQGLGLQVVVAHPERYGTIQNDLDVAQQMHDMGCLFMASAGFLDKTYWHGKGKTIKKTAKKLFKAGLIDIISTDSHCVDDYKWLEPALKFASKYGYDDSRSQQILSQAILIKEG